MEKSRKYTAAVLILYALTMSALFAMIKISPVHATAPAAYIESCDSTGTIKDIFNPSETVYATGGGYERSTAYKLYVVPDTTWTDGKAISGTPVIVYSNRGGRILPTNVMSPPLTPGKYDIVVDVNGNGMYDAGIDVLDDCDVQGTAGFLVIPEFWLGTILGLAGCFAAFGAFHIKKRKHYCDKLSQSTHITY